MPEQEDEKVYLSLLRKAGGSDRVKTPEGAKRFGQPINSIIKKDSALSPASSGSSFPTHKKSIPPHKTGAKLSEQPDGFDLSSLPIGSRLKRTDKSESFVKTKTGWKHKDSGADFSEKAFAKFKNRFELAHVPTAPLPIDKAKRAGTSIKAAAYGAALKISEADVDETITKNDKIQHFAQEFLLQRIGAGGGHGVHTSNTALDRVIKLSEENVELSILRHVKTQAGVRKFHKPIGAEITDKHDISAAPLYTVITVRPKGVIPAYFQKGSTGWTSMTHAAGAEVLRDRDIEREVESPYTEVFVGKLTSQEIRNKELFKYDDGH